MSASKTLIATAVAGLTAIALLGGAQPVLALFSAQSAASNSTTATAIAAGSTPGTAVSGRDVLVSWTASALPGSSPAATSSTYTVVRFAATAPTVAITPVTGCAGTLSTLSCTDSALAAGSWTYAITPGRASWLGPRGASSATATVGAAALVLSTANVGAGGTLTGTVSNYLDGQTVNYCLDQATSAGCTSGNRIGFATVPATGGTVAATLTIPAGTTAGSHTVSAYGSLGDATSQPLTVNSLAGLQLTNPQVKGNGVTLNCGAVTATRTCTDGASGQTGNRSATFTVTLLNAAGAAVNNPGPGVATVSFTQSGASAAPASTTIASGASSTGTVSYQLGNGQSGRITATVTISGVVYTITAPLS